MQLVVRLVALEELDAARIWYDEQRAGLGAEFVDAAAASISHAAQAPTAFPQVHRSIRRLLMRRFPYAIFYRVTVAEIVILAVMHLRRDPKRWQSRR